MSRRCSRHWRWRPGLVSGHAVALVGISLLAAPPYSAAADEPESFRSYCTDETPASVESGVLRVLTLNASHGRDTAINQLLVDKEQTYENLDDIADLLVNAEADVVALQEADGPSRWSGGLDHVAYVFDQSGYACAIHGFHSMSRMANYGTALLSRTELLEPLSTRFPPSPPTKQKGFVSAKLRWDALGGDGWLTVVSVHLDFLRDKTRDAQIADMVARLGDVDGPLIILGDLNSEWNEKDSHVQQLATKLGLSVFEPDSEELGTYKKSSGKRLDWILISDDLDFRLHRVLPDVVADHFAVYAEIGYRGKPGQ